MPVLGPKENWEKTGRWKSFEELFKLKGQNKKEYALNPTHEEIISPLAKKIKKNGINFFIHKKQDLSLHLVKCPLRIPLPSGCTEGAVIGTATRC